MAKGSGLSFDPDHTPPLFHDNPTVIINSFQDNHHSHPKFYGYNNNPHGRKLKFEPVLLSSSSSSSSAVAASAASSSSLIIPSSMEIESSVNNRSSSPPTIPFPVNLNSTGTTIITTNEDQNKPVIGEMDFFARNNDICSKATSTIDADASDIKDRTVPTELNFNVNTGLHLLTGITSSDQSMVDDGISPQSDEKKAKNELAILQAELERMNSENRRLKETLNQVTNNYNNLHMHLMTLMQQQQQRDNNNNNNNNQRAEDSGVELENDQTGKNNIVEGHRRHGGGGGVIVPRHFMDLRLAPSTATETADETSLSSSEGRTSVGGRDRSQSPTGTNIEGSTAAGAGNSCVREDDSPEKSSHWVPNKVSRVNQAPKNVDQATEATMRKARVSVRARSDAPMISDGCQWRKYGQKMAKGNPCPRAYYRCTMAAGCPVRKQVQRCAEDKEILITTYEGNHNHPLPPAAMAMASTTSSAARMLLSGSMPSADGIMNSNFLARTLLPCSSSMATISASAPFPTVTLDLTQNPNPLQFQRNPIINNNSQFHVPFPNSSQNLISNPASGLLPHIFGQALYNQSKFSGLQMSHDSHEAAAAAAAANQLIGHQGQQNPLADTVTALTADPNFTAALAAAITSLIGNSHPNTVANKIHNNVTTTTTSTTTTTNNNNNGSVTTISNNNSNGNNKVLNSSFPSG